MPKDPHITGGIRHDWAAIKHEYVTDPDATLRKIADKYGIRRDTVYKKSKAEGWFATRKETQAKVGAKAIAKTTNKMALELSQESDFLAMMKGHMNKMLSDQDQFQRHIVEEITVTEEGKVYSTSEAVFDKFDSRAMKDSMQILQMMESMTRSLQNIQKAESIQKQQLERERFEFDKEMARQKLELEKEKIALERERNALRSGNIDADTNYGVVLMPEVISNE